MDTTTTGPDRVQLLAAELMERCAETAVADRPDPEAIESAAWDLTERGYDAADAPGPLVQALLWPAGAAPQDRDTCNRLADALQALDAGQDRVLLETRPEEGLTGFVHLILYVGGHDLELADEHARLLMAADIDLDATMAAAGWRRGAPDCAAWAGAAAGPDWQHHQIEGTTYAYTPFTR